MRDALWAMWALHVLCDRYLWYHVPCWAGLHETVLAVQKSTGKGMRDWFAECVVHVRVQQPTSDCNMQNHALPCTCQSIQGQGTANTLQLCAAIQPAGSGR